ncbi:MAG: MarR family winged helix-turn-helix transcriptional regulator [Janthinobacterium lividum]
MNDVLITLMREVSTNFQMRLSELPAIDELKLAPFQARLLSVIGRSPGISQLALTVSTERDKAQVARAIKELERRDFIVRSAHESEWRMQCLNVTKEGKRASALLDLQRAELVAKALHECSAQEQDALSRILEKINRSIS